jgi:iron complex transport system substrate-binding protein
VEVKLKSTRLDNPTRWLNMRSRWIALLVVAVIVEAFVIGYLADTNNHLVGELNKLQGEYRELLSKYQGLQGEYQKAIARASALSDALGREVRLSEVPKRVVSTLPSITEFLFVLGLGDKVVGVDSYSNWPPEVLELVKQGKIAVVGGPWTLDVEKIASLKPDLVLMGKGVGPQMTQFAPKLEEKGIKTFFLISNTAKDQYDIFTDIRTLGKIFGVEQRAAEVIESIQQRINNATSKLASVTKKPKVLQLAGPPSWGLYSAGGDTFIGWLITTAGGENIASKYGGWPKLSYEDILSNNPEVIMVTVMNVDPKKVIEEISQTPLTNTIAWKSGRVYVLTGEADDLICRPGPRIADALEMIAQIIHPEIFGEVKRHDVVKMTSLGLELKGTSLLVSVVNFIALGA